MKSRFHTKILVTTILLALSSEVYSLDVGNEVQSVTKQTLDKGVGKLERQSRLYYKLGGSRPMSAPPSYQGNIKLGGKVKYGAGYSCGQFDPSASLQNFMNDINKQADDAMNQLAQAATSALRSLPAAELARNSPDIYELMQTNVFRAEEKYKFNASSCQEMERQIANGENPYKEWTELAQATKLDEESEKNPDVNEAMEEVEKDGGDDGVYMPVPGKGIKKAGGKNQEPIQIVDIATTTGYNTMLQRSPTTVTAPTSDKDLSSDLVQTFKTPADMSKWTADVLGEQDIYTTKSPLKDPESTPGKGILAKAILEKSEVKGNLQKLISKAVTDDESDDEQNELRAKVSTNNALITSDLIRKLQQSGEIEREIIIDGLASEIALNKQIDKAMLVRRSLIMGKSEKNISASGAAKKAIDEKIKDLENEIQQAMFEYRLRKELVSDLVTDLYNSPGISPQGSSGSLNTPKYMAN